MALLEGLEVNVEMFSDLSNIKEDTFRIDSEHYRKKYQVISNRIQRHENKKIRDLIVQPVTTGHTPSMKIEKYYGGNIKFIKTDNLRENKITEPYTHYLSILGNETRLNSELKENDIITTIIGATYSIVGRTSIIQKEILPANINQNIALIRADERKIEPNYLNIFLNTKYGRGMLYYHSRQTEQVNLNCREVERVLVPLFANLQNNIREIVKQIEVLKIKSKQTYAQAEKLLLAEIGLQDFKASDEAVNIKSFQDSFATSGRLDAEFYQKKYDVIENKFNEFERIKLNSLVEHPISSGITPKAGGNAYTDKKHGVPFIRAVDLQGGEVSLSNNNYIKYDVHNSILKRTQLKKGDVLLSIAGTVGRCALFNYNIEANINQAVSIIRFNQDKVFRLYLVVFFNSFLGKEFVSKFARQGVQTNLSLAEVGNLSIPIIEYTKQQQIADLIEQSFALKKQSEHLLEVAKRAVEIAIEQNEAEAMEYIQAETREDL